MRQPSAAAPSAAPSAAAPSAAASSATLAYKGEITFWNTQRDIENVELQKEVQAWQALHPGITVKTDLVPFDGADKKYTDAANAGTAPDIFRADIGWTPTFADAGMLLDLTSLLPGRLPEAVPAGTDGHRALQGRHVRRPAGHRRARAAVQQERHDRRPA